MVVVAIHRYDCRTFNNRSPLFHPDDHIMLASCDFMAHIDDNLAKDIDCIRLSTAHAHIPIVNELSSIVQSILPH